MILKAAIMVVEVAIQLCAIGEKKLERPTEMTVTQDKQAEPLVLCDMETTSDSIIA